MLTPEEFHKRINKEAELIAMVAVNLMAQGIELSIAMSEARKVVKSAVEASTQNYLDALKEHQQFNRGR